MPRKPAPKRLYAEGTTVSPEKSRAEIETILSRYGADKFMSGYDKTTAVIIFEAHGTRVRFVLPLPELVDFRRTKAGQSRNESSMQSAYEAEVRRRWRSLAAAIKAKLDAVETGITTFQEEFMPHILLPTGNTVSEWMLPQIARIYETGQMPPMLPMLPSGQAEDDDFEEGVIIHDAD